MVEIRCPAPSFIRRSLQLCFTVVPHWDFPLASGWWESAMSRVRFQLLFGPPSAHPLHMSWSESNGAWYCWRLMGANNRELGRSASSFGSYPGVRRAVHDLQKHAARLVRATVVDPATGRWGWRLDLDDRTVAMSGRWYERDHDSQAGMDKFVHLLPDADLDDGVVTLHERRRSGI